MSGRFEPRLRQLEITTPARVVEAASPPLPGALVTGWAALRLAGGAFFDGVRSPVSVLVPASAHPRPRAGLRWVRRDVDERARGATVGYLRLVGAGEALVDHVADEVRSGCPREAVVAVDMALAAGICRLEDARAAAGSRGRLSGRASVERVLSLARYGSASPPESRLRLAWSLDAGLPEPVLNTWIHDDHGRRVAVPDLLDEESGLVVEYDGEGHADVRRRTRDAEKDDLYRHLGLEPVRITSLDMRNPSRVTERLLRARRRALGAARPRRWRLGEPFTGASARSSGPRT